jgi:hypothetical protein
MSVLSRPWWDSLHIEGLLISPGKLVEYFGAELEPLDRPVVDRLRRDLTLLLEDQDHLGVCLDTVLEQLLGLDRLRWRKDDQVGSNWSHPSIHGGAIRPRRLWEGPRDEILPVFTVEREQSSRRETSRVIEWLRKADRPLALLTNGVQLRLIHASPHYVASCDWDLRMWFEEGQPGPQVTALRQLLRREAIALLPKAIAESRRAQGELSAVLGERVRQAVEKLIQASSNTLEPLLVGPNPVAHQSIYIAAARLVMRMVVVLFVEARNLLPRKDLHGLHEQLERAAGGRADRLGSRHGAWPRILGLFRLIDEGSHHEDPLVSRYGGGLFRPGEADSEDSGARVLARFEHPRCELSDRVIHEILRLLTHSKFKVRQGRGSIWVDGPVNFATLDTEYIGILYQGLLDYELRRAPSDDPIVFLNIGDQPALPFSRLAEMNVEAREQLFSRLAEQDQAAEPESADEIEDEQSSDELDDTARWHRNRVHEWARKAVGNPGAAARRLVARVVLPQQWFLVRWGGTRKGSGTFYTPPQLARATTRRTLQPLAYEPVNPREDAETGLVEVDEWVVKTPEQILQLRVCDPAMGSGSFLVAALDYLSDALFESLHVHGRIELRSDHTIVRLAYGPPGDELRDHSLPVPIGHDEFEPRLRALIKRQVVERGIYGVDLDPLAVELARLALWIETMDPRLPFEFLDHKLRCGNSLVGCWFDRFENYPILAWEREGGDKGHGNFVHHFREVPGKGNEQAERKGDAWTEAIKQRKGEIKDELVALIRARRQPVVTDARDRLEEPALASLQVAFDTWCALWFWPGDTLELAPTPQTLSKPSQPSLQIVERLREEHRFFHWELEFFDVFTGPEAGFDAILGNPPWDIQKPNSKEFFSNVEPLYRGLGKQAALRWQSGAFEANADLERDWIAHQARFKSLSNWVRSVGEPFGDPDLDPAGKGYSLARRDNLELHRVWRQMRGDRRGFADPEHPFRHQGSADLNSYKLFVEIAHALTRVGGRIGVVIPSGLYTDKGTADLRALLLERCRWEWLFGFENRDKVFAIDGRFKFAAVLAEKGARTSALRTAFMRRDLADWDAARPHGLAYPRARVAQFSPKSRTILEVSAARDLEVLQKLYDNGVLLGDDGPDGWGIEYATEFHMTSDSKRFAPRRSWEEKGYRADEYGHWLAGGWKPYSGSKSVLKRNPGVVLSRDGGHAIPVGEIEGVALPLYEGRMIGQFDFCEKGWVRGKGRSAQWREISWRDKVFEPQYLMARETASSVLKPKVAFMAIGSASNRRSMISSFVEAFPAGNSLGVLRPRVSGVLVPALALTGILNSFVFDAVLRCRLGGLNINHFILEELPLPRFAATSESEAVHTARLAGRLSLASATFARSSLRGRDELGTRHWRRSWALTPAEVLRTRVMIDAVVTHWLGLSENDLRHVLRGCDWPQPAHGADPKGFWRIDSDKPPELRHTVLSLIAFHDLQRMGLKVFLDQNDGEGWMLPKTLRLADYGLGHDDRAKQHQPVADLLGPRFFDWQLAQSVEQSWEECERHAELLEQILPLAKSGVGVVELDDRRGAPRD